MSEEDDYMKRMVNALRSGAKMLADQCPVCNSPLFEIKGQIWCLRCNKRVIKVSGDEEVEEALSGLILSDIAKALTAKLEELTILLKKASEIDEINELSRTINSLLEALEKASKLKEHFTSKPQEE